MREWLYFSLITSVNIVNTGSYLISSLLPYSLKFICHRADCSWGRGYLVIDRSPPRPCSVSGSFHCFRRWTWTLSQRVCRQSGELSVTCRSPQRSSGSGCAQLLPWHSWLQKIKMAKDKMSNSMLQNPMMLMEMYNLYKIYTKHRSEL